jgi:hypothetical protein
MSDWKPTEKQSTALMRKEFEVLFGGARGGGKTDAGQAWLLYDIENPALRALVLRRNADDLKDWTDRANRMWARCGAVMTGATPIFTFPSGAVIRTGHLKDENAYSKYQGHEYQRLLIEELTQIPRERDYLMVLSSCRSSVPELRPQVFATTNPGGPGHEWVKHRFGMEGTPREPIVTDDPVTGRSRVFVPSRIDDNPHLMEADPDYVKFLDGLPDGLREAWRDGSWDDYDIEGAYYSSPMRQAENEGRVSKVPHDPALEVYTFWDLGIGDFTAVWFVQLSGKEVRVIDYYEGSGQGLDAYAKVLRDKPYLYREHWMPHDIEVREMGTGKSRKEAAEKLGIRPLMVVPRLSVDDGINALRMAFPRLWFDRERCADGIRALKNYRAEFDDRLGERKRAPLHDWSSHAADAARYMAVVLDKLRPSSGRPTMTDAERNFYIARREKRMREARKSRAGLRMA